MPPGHRFTQGRDEATELNKQMDEPDHTPSDGWRGFKPQADNGLQIQSAGRL